MLPIPDYKYNAPEVRAKPFNLDSGKIKLKIVFLVGFLIVGLFFTQLVFANNLATDGQKLSQVQEEIKSLEKENMTLSAQIAQESSLVNLSKIAPKLGFSKPLKITAL